MRKKDRLGRMAVIAIAVILIAAAGANASAQEQVPNPRIGVIDLQLILGKSKAGQSIRPQISQMSEQLKASEQREAKALREKEQAIAQQRTLLAPDALAQRQRELREDAIAARRKLTDEKEDVQRMMQDARNQVLAALQKIAIDIAKEQSLNLVMFKSQVFVVTKTLDITEVALTRLDKALPSVKLGAEESKPATPPKN